ncbi:MAG: hypothetical protein HKN30_04860 [Sulfitobacter sp.]|nr:hypothetical protein [Sulfitobacter sp.]
MTKVTLGAERINLVLRGEAPGGVGGLALMTVPPLLRLCLRPEPDALEDAPQAAKA